MKQNHSNHKNLNKIVLLDQKEIEQEKANDKAFSKSPVIKNLIEVKITNATSIFIPRGKNKEEARQRFLINHKQSIF